MRYRDFIQQENIVENQFAKPFLIAEAGVNHEGSMEIVKRLISEAQEGGADAIKFQAYKAETLASKNSPSYWDLSAEPTTSQFKLFKKHDKFWKKEFEAIKETCDVAGIEFLCTPFDIESSAFLNDLIDVFKISSSDITNRPFIEHICHYNKPIILSTGASYLWEVHRTVEWIENIGNDVALLHCILNYPTLDKNANLGVIALLRKQFQKHIIGYSDHTLPGEMKNLEIASLLGAKILEKHFSHDKTLPGNDHYHAMDMEDLKRFTEQMKSTIAIVGNQQKTVLASEEVSRRNARRSLVASGDIPKGKVIEPSDLTFKRPAHGICPSHINEVVGRKAAIQISEDDILKWSMLVEG